MWLGIDGRTVPLWSRTWRPGTVFWVSQMWLDNYMWAAKLLQRSSSPTDVFSGSNPSLYLFFFYITHFTYCKIKCILGVEKHPVNYLDCWSNTLIGNKKLHNWKTSKLFGVIFSSFQIKMSRKIIFKGLVIVKVFLLS